MLAIILNVLVIVALGLGVYFSYRRGLKGSLVHFAFVLTSFVIAVFVTFPITRAVLGIQVGVTSSGEIITLGSYISSSLTQTTVAIPLFSSIASALISPFVFLVMAALFYAIFEIGYILANKFWLKKTAVMKEPKEHKKYGLIVGAFECLLVTLLAFMPLTTLTSTVEELSTSQTTEPGSIGNLLNENLPPIVTEFVAYYNSSPIGVLTNWGSLNEPITSAVSPIYAGQTQLSLKQDLLPIAKDYDKVLEAISGENGIDYDTLREVADDVLNSKVFTALEGEFKIIIENKESFVSSLNLDRALSFAVTDILTNFEIKFEESSFDFKGYMSENIEIALDELEHNVNLQTISDFADCIYRNEVSQALGQEYIVPICDTLESITKLPMMRELFPIVEFCYDQLPAFITDYVDINLLMTYEDTLADLPYIINVVKDFVSQVDDSGNNFLQELLYGDANFTQKFLDNSIATDVIYNMASSLSMHNLVVNIFERMDSGLASSLQKVEGTFNTSQLKTTISFADADSVIDEFMTKVSAQAENIISVIRTIMNEADLSNGEVLNTLKEQIIYYFDFENMESNSVFTAVFENVIAYFSGEILRGDALPAFSNYEMFNSLVDSAFESVAEEDKIYGELSKYLLVDYTQIFASL